MSMHSAIRGKLIAVIGDEVLITNLTYQYQAVENVNS